MNLILVDVHEVDDRGRLVLGGRRARHVREVLRAAPGDRLRVGAMRGPRGAGEVTALRGDGLVELRVTWEAAPPEPPAVDLILAVPRPKAVPRVLQAAASMGVRRIDLVNAWRVDKSYLHSGHLDPDRLRHHLTLGCEQGGLTWVPDIAVHRLLMPFLRGALAGRLSAAPVCPLIAHPRAARMLESAVPPGAPVPVIAAIGPERGWIDRELASFADLGFVPVALGRGVWRVDTAVVALLAQLELLARMRARPTS